MRLRFSILALTVLTTLVAAGNATAQLKGNLVIGVSGLSNQQGALCVKLFAGSQGFPDGDAKAVKQECAKITGNAMQFKYSGLPSGSYAIAVYHDANGDRKLNRNSAGMPTEGYGFSNNPVVKAGPPKFGQAVFLIAGPNTRKNIQMRYGN